MGEVELDLTNMQILVFCPYFPIDNFRDNPYYKVRN